PLLLIGMIMAAPGRVASGEWRVASYEYAVLDAGYSPSAPARPAAASLVGHVTIQGHPAQPSPLQSVPLTITLNSADCNGTASDYSTTTDQSGFFTVTAPAPGVY